MSATFVRPRALLAVLALFFVAACDGDGARCTALPGGARYCLQSTADIAPFDAQQQVDVRFGGRLETMIAQLENDASGVRLALMTPFGQKLLQLSYDNSRFQAQPPSLQGLDPLLLLALVQIAMWPAPSVNSGFAGSATLVDTPGTRRLLRDGKELLAITYARGRPPLGDAAIVLYGAGVEFTIMNLDRTDPE